MPRLSTPRVKIPAGAVGIGGNQTGVYPDYNGKRIANVYREYQKTLKLNNALDFDDLIYKTRCV